ncbi:MAG: hypothetical protein ABH950_03635 [Candidatus Altiarchaeota archaeon]
MVELANLLTSNLTEILGVIKDLVLDYTLKGLIFFAILIGSYIIGFGISLVLRRVLLLKEWREALVKYGAMSSNLWESTVHFLSQYIKWFSFVFLLDFFLVSKTETAVSVAYSFPVLHELLVLMGAILWFILLSIFGIMLGGVLSKFFKDVMKSIGFEEELAKHKVEKVMGQVSLSVFLTGILRWYIVLLFVAQGVAKLNLPQLTSFTDNLINYIPNAILGLLILIASLLIGGYISATIKGSKTLFKELIAPLINGLIVYFGVVLSLPKFGVADVSILVDAFRIFALGLALALGIAFGWGLKDSVSRIAEKHEKEF